MLYDLLKILIDEPQRLKALFIKFVQLILSIIMASHAFEWLFGPHELINILSLSDWVGFIISGRLLLVLFVFLVTDYIVFSILPAFTNGFFILTARKFTFKGQLKEARKELRWVFKMLKIIEIDEVTNKVIAGPYSGPFQSGLDYLASDEGKVKFYEMRNSYLNEIIHTYLIFTLVFSLYIKHTVINNIAVWVYIIAAILGIFYMVFSFVLSLIEKNAANLSVELYYLRKAKMLRDEYMKYDIYTETTDPYPCAIITFNGRPVNIYWLPTQHLIDGHHIELKINEAKEHESTFKLLTNGDLTASARKLYEGNRDVCEILFYNDDADLLTHVKTLALLNEPVFVEMAN